MKHNIKYILSVCIGIALTMGLSAQTLNSSYFMEKMTKRNQLNPALKTPNGYVSFPALGNFYLGVNSNLGLGTFLYPRGNELVTFLHPSVPADDFLGKLTPNNTVELDLGLDIISFGFWAWGGQNTFNLALKSYSGAYMPKEIFQFLKTGQKETGITRYDMSNITVSTDNYVELALGHARDINDKLGVGAKVKVLVGAAHAEARIDRMDISMSQDEWFIKQAGHIQASSLLKLETDPETGEITDYDTSEYLENEQDIIAYLNAIAEYDDPALMQAALGNVAKARGMTQIAKDAGVGRESLYKSLSKDGNPSFQTIAKVIHALGGRLTIQAA